MAVPYYNVGTATLTAGSPTMTGQGTLWVGNVRPGDQVVSYAGETAIVGTVDSNTSITLVRAFRGTSQAAAAYEIVYTPDDPFTQMLARQVLQAISGSALVGLSGLTPAARKLPVFDETATAALADLSDAARALLALPGAAGKLPYFTGNDTAALTDLSDVARTLLAGATGAAMYGVLGVAPDASMPDRFRQDGATIPSGNYNLALNNGFYRGFGAGSINPPPGSASFGSLLVIGLGGLRVQQIAMYSNQAYWRSTIDGGTTWTAWDIFVPTVSTTASGTTIRLPGRAQICTSHVPFGGETGIAYGSIFLGAEFRWTYPTAFDAAAGIPRTTGWVIATGSRTWVTGGGQTSPDYLGTPIQLASATANMSSGYVSLIASGSY